MPQPILVTGASGTLGQAVIRKLRLAGYTTRCGSRNPDRCKDGHEAVRFAWNSPLTYRPAVDGVKQVFLTVRPLDISAASVVPDMLEDCRLMGVEHVVFVSALGADEQIVGPLGLAERVLQHSGMRWTILRPNFFMENFSHGWLRSAIKSAGKIELPAGKGRTSFVSVEDVAAVVDRVFSDQTLQGRAYDLTGDDPMSHTAVAAALTRASGRPVNYEPLDPDQLRGRARRAGLPAGQLEYLLALYRMVREGKAARVSRDLAQILGRKPRRFAEFAVANADCWRVAVAAVD